MKKKRFSKHTGTLATVVAGLAVEVFSGLREKGGDLIAKEGLACLLGTPGAGLLATALVSAGGSALTGLGINLFSAQITENGDDGLNHALAKASGAAIATVVRDEAPRDPRLKAKARELELLAAEIERQHSPEVLEESSDETLPIDPGAVIEDPRGFLRQTALSKDEWMRYLLAVAEDACSQHRLVRSDIDAIAESLEHHYTAALYRAIQVNATSGGKAVAGAVIRLLNTVLASLDAKHADLISTTEATWRAVCTLRKDLDVPRLTRAVDALELSAREHAAALRELRATFVDLPRLLDGLEKRLIEEIRRVPDEAAAKTAALLRREGLVNLPLRSNIQPLVGRRFHGRDVELDTIADRFADANALSVAVLHGPPGVGKSELAREFARRCAAQYTGAALFVEVGAAGFAAALAETGARVLGIHRPDLPLDAQAYAVLEHLGREPSLVIYDVVTDPVALMKWLPPASSRCHVLVTTNHDDWTAEFGPIAVPILPAGDASRVVEELAPNSPASQRGAVVKHAGGVAQQLVPLAKALAKAVKRGREFVVALTKEASTSYAAPYQQIDDDGRLLLHAVSFLKPVSIPMTELEIQLLEPLGWTKERLHRAIDTCLDASLLDSVDGVRMHQLLSTFVAAQSLTTTGAESIHSVRSHQRSRLLAIAHRVATNPADAVAIRELAVFPAGPEQWEHATVSLATEDGETFGHALGETGRFDEARPWFERAVADTERGDVHGRVDHQALGTSLHGVGYCHGNMGRFDDARPWFERAVAETERGDVHGRVDHASLGLSLHSVGDCHASVGRFDDARPWFERAVTEAERGDVHGRVDHTSLGRSLHLVGGCHASMGRFDDARPWFERAVAEKEHGDVHGRVDHASLGLSLHQVGYCHLSMGRFDEARPWFERAVAEAERGDIHGRVDHQSLGSSLHSVGYCHSSMGRFDDARPWFERATAEKERGDVHGRVDHESLGSSLHSVGNCHSSMGRFDDARPWFERAAAEKERGDIHGRVDHVSLGSSLHSVGDCHASVGGFDDARPWFERAVAEAEHGDVDGRVDHESLGMSLHDVGYCHSSMGRFDDARPWFERAAAEAERGDIHGRVDEQFLAVLRRSLADFQTRSTRG